MAWRHHGPKQRVAAFDFLAPVIERSLCGSLGDSINALDVNGLGTRNLPALGAEPAGNSAGTA